MGEVEEKTEKCGRDIIIFYLKLHFLKAGNILFIGVAKFGEEA